MDRDDPYIDSLKRGVERAQTPQDKVEYLSQLASFAVDPALLQRLGNELILTAELSRDRRLIVRSYLVVARRLLSNSGLSSNLDRATQYVAQAEKMARDNGLGVWLVYSYCAEADIWRSRGNMEKALTCGNEALSAAGTLDNDSASERALTCLGEVYMDRNEMVLALRNLLEAQDVAERSGDPTLEREVYGTLDEFYDQLHEYDKAIDYEMKAYELCRKIGHPGMVRAQYRIGDLFSEEHQPELALQFYERALRTADTLKFPLLKFDIYFRTFNMYFRSDEVVKAMRYLEDHRDVVDVLKRLGFGFYVDQLYGIEYFKQGRYDSALRRLKAAEPLVEERGNPEVKCNFYENFGDYYSGRGDYPTAIGYYRKAYGVGTAVGQLTWEEQCADTLVWLYERVGDMRNALYFKKVAVTDQDSLRSSSQTSDLMRLEVENDRRRRERQAQEEELSTERRHNIQYMGFTVGLVLFFIVVVLLGHLSVPAAVIRAVVFLSFIFLFEFIILLTDKWIQAVTHDEPWKVLLIKVLLAAGLVPLHHWLEHKVIHYLSHRRKGTVKQQAHV